MPRYSTRMSRGITQSCLKSLTSLIMAVTLLLSFQTTAVFAQTSEPLETTFEDNYAKLKEDTTLQFELAKPKVREVKKRRNRSGALGAWEQTGGAIMKGLFYGICAALVATVLFFILREFIHVRFPAKKAEAETEEEEIPLYMPDTEAAQILLGDVDTLAKEGKFADAIHTLLFRSIQDIEDKRPHSIKQSFTSREIAELKILSPEARTAFSHIGRVVEEGFFGNKALGKPEFDACREAYVQFTRPKAWA